MVSNSVYVWWGSMEIPPPRAPMGVKVPWLIKGTGHDFAGQENPFIIFRSKEIYISKQITKSP